MRRLITLVVVLTAVLLLWNVFEKYSPSTFTNFFKTPVISPQLQPEKVRIITEESGVIDIVKKVGPSVVTVAEESSAESSSYAFPFPFFEEPPADDQVPQNIGSGFIVSSEGLIVTNKHVVSDLQSKYFVFLGSNDKKYEVRKIYRDPLNDIAIIKIDPADQFGQKLNPVDLGDSSKLEVGQFVVAIGTALGEFKNTVTTGVISGLGRGITAGSAFQGYVEQLENVIQTDAAINPGNSGGPLLNSAGQVIGINTAVASGGQNIGFALPINVVKESLKNFNDTGQFNRPYLGVVYQMVKKEAAILNNVPEGAYVRRIVKDSAADKAGIETGDIITEIDGQKLAEGKTEIVTVIAKKKVGDTLLIKLFRDSKIVEVRATLEAAPNQ